MVASCWLGRCSIIAVRAKGELPCDSRFCNVFLCDLTVDRAVCIDPIKHQYQILAMQCEYIWSETVHFRQLSWSARYPVRHFISVVVHMNLPIVTWNYSDYFAGVFIHYNGSKKLSYPAGPNRSRKHLNSSSGHVSFLILSQRKIKTIPFSSKQNIYFRDSTFSCTVICTLPAMVRGGGLCIFKAVWMEYPLCYYYMKTMRSQTY